MIEPRRPPHLVVDEGTSVTALVIDFLEAGLRPLPVIRCLGVMVDGNIGDVDLMTRVDQLRGPGTVAGPGPSGGGRPIGPAPTQTPTPRAAASPAARSCGDRTQTPGSVLLNDIHRDAQGFVERRVEPEISYTYTVKSKNSPWAQQGALVPDGGQHRACAAAQA